MSTLTMAQSSKNICTPLTAQGSSGVINPSQIPPSVLWNMTSSASNSATGIATKQFNIAISLCEAVPTKACGDAAYIAVATQGDNATCASSFDTVLTRPTLGNGGITVTYGSSKKQNANDIATVTIVCNSEAPASLTSRSHKYQVRGGNKLGGNTYTLLAYSSAACATKPAPPPSPSAPVECKRFTIGNTLVNPSSWSPSFLTLQNGFFGEKHRFLFSLCNNEPKLPADLPKCKDPGYITQYNSTGCISAQHNLTHFAPGADSVRFAYEKKVDWSNEGINTVVSIVSVNCLKGASTLRSPTGMFNSTQINGTLYVVFPLGHEDLCISAATTRPSETKPTGRPTLPTFTIPNNWTVTKPNNWTWPSNFTFPTETRETRPETKPPQTKPPQTLPTVTRETRPETKPTETRPPETKPPQTKPPQTGTRPPETKPPQTGTRPPETKPPQTGTRAPETKPPQTETRPAVTGTRAPETKPPQTGTRAPETKPPQTETRAPQTKPPQTETQTSFVPPK